jgi:hypothetical protein
MEFGLVSAVLNLQVLLSESKLISKMELRETGCEDGRWMELAQDRVQWRALAPSVLNTYRRPDFVLILL